jgi:hypothetical protein
VSAFRLEGLIDRRNEQKWELYSGPAQLWGYNAGRLRCQNGEGEKWERVLRESSCREKRTYGGKGTMDLLSGRSASVGASMYWIWRDGTGLKEQNELRLDEDEGHGSNSCSTAKAS